MNPTDENIFLTFLGVQQGGPSVIKNDYDNFG